MPHDEDADIRGSVVAALGGMGDRSIKRTANPQTEDLDFHGFDSVRFLISGGGIPRGGISQKFRLGDSQFAGS